MHQTKFNPGPRPPNETLHAYRVLSWLLLLAFVASAPFAPKIWGSPALRHQSPQYPLQKPAATSLTLKLCLEDASPFQGAATVHVLPEEGYELLADVTDTSGEFSFSRIPPGKYFAEVSAPGYLTLRLRADITADAPQKSLLVIMKPRPQSKQPQPALGTAPEPQPAAAEPKAEFSLPPAADPKTETSPPESPSPAPSSAARDFWSPHDLEQTIPRAGSQVACPQESVLANVGERMKEFVSTLEKFTAVESVEHYAFTPAGERKTPETRKFNYVVGVTQNNQGTFLLEEFRNGSTDPAQFPAGIASLGLPAMNLLFHPALASDFDLRCEGLGEWKGRRAWQVHFTQKKDKP
ncbi:MAG TPA: carboxypeptidase-like regulatory domain-containing protein, partial [Candidatus Acidoferrum sp.]|nr:carboxypeptidase-like regulatory domain-containing protein [Candidatus Acidoferrum sp.]